MTGRPPLARAAGPARARPAAVAAAAAAVLTLAACSSAARPVALRVTGTPRPAADRQSRTPGASGPPPALSASLSAAALPAPLARAVVLPDGGDLMILGGLDSADQATSGVFLLSPASGSVRSLGSLPDVTHDAAGAVIGGADVVFGGGTAVSISTVQAWRSGSGGQVIGQLPEPRSDLSAVTIGGTVYLLGGYDGAVWSSSVLATTTGTSFRVAARLCVPVRYAAAAASGGRIIVAGGHGTAGYVRTIQEVDPATGRCSVIGSLPVPLAHAAALVLGGRVYVAGGRTAAGTASDKIWAVNPATGTVTPAGTLPTGVSDAGAAVIGSTGYLVGGAGQAPLNSVITLRQR